MITNQFTLLGRVGYIDMKYTESGVGITTINLGVKRNKEIWENIFIKFIDTQKFKHAENAMNKIQKGDYIRVIGTITDASFTPKDSDKEIYKIELIAWKFDKVEYNEMIQDYEIIEK